ncbi:MAG TPA: GNAT family N-acetyltransferase [Anaerolineales bacterium]|jgi:GNAT superfamily N-acetyltransferase|nr:GNAT family N-acetyltransferase [Anaerolineales bacterium]
MTHTQFIQADIQIHNAELLKLNIEYIAWVWGEFESYFHIHPKEIVGMSAEDSARLGMVKVCDQKPPEGVFYIVKFQGQLAGMGGLRGLGSKLADIKRIYVRSNMRGFRLGEQILSRLLDDARSYGYDSVYLDTAPYMKAAHHLYEKFGFVDRQPYKETEAPIEFHDRWRFMEKSLLPH